MWMLILTIVLVMAFLWAQVAAMGVMMTLARDRRAPRVGCRFKVLGGEFANQIVHGDVSTGGAMVLLPRKSESPTLHLLLLPRLPGHEAPGVMACGQVVAVRQVAEARFCHHLKFDPGAPVEHLGRYLAA